MARGLAFLLLLLLAHWTNAAKLLIIAQGRSGSSFLSSWFGVSPSALYFLEPCSSVYVKTQDNTDKTGVHCAKYVREVFACELANFNIGLDQRPRIPSVAVGFIGWGNQTDASSCKEKTDIVIKELRLGQAWANGEVQFGDDVKIVVLLRDPRAIRSSRKSGWPKPTRKNDTQSSPPGWNGMSGFPYDQSLKSLCKEHLDLKRRAALEPERALVVQYHDVLRNPLAVAKRIFEHLGASRIPEQVATHIEKNIKGECEHLDAPFSVCRKLRAASRDDKWKASLDASDLAELGKIEECKMVWKEEYAALDEGEEEKKRREDKSEL